LGGHSDFIDNQTDPNTMTASTLCAATTTAAASFCTAAFPGARLDSGIPVSWGDMMGHRDYLVRFARRKLHDPALAEDAVHDVFEAVISGRASFAGRAALRSWLTAILKNKVIDVIRQRARYDSIDIDQQEDDARQMECAMARPDELAEQRELLRQTMQRIADLPQGLRDVMQFRVLQDESSQAVCQRLRISEASLFVRLHRARKQLLC
jgi:RNA polymerase sigma-70 factor (ECF subfamily)